MGKRHHHNLTIRGVTYPTASDAARAIGVTEGQVRMAARLGRLDGLGTRSKNQDIVIRGVRYDSFAAAARALGVNPNTVRAAARNGTLHRVGTGRVGPEPMRVQIAGQVFESVHDAAAKFGCCPYTIWAAIAAGDPDRVARSQRYNPWRARPYRIGPLSFPSMAAASRALGFDRDDFISKAVKRKSRRGMARILAAALAFEAARMTKDRPVDSVRLGFKRSGQSIQGGGVA